MLRHALTAAAISTALSLSACGVPETASRAETLELTGVVRGVDTEARRLVVEGQDRTVVYRVGDEVRNFDQIEVGDEVALDYHESVAVAMADPADTGEPLTDVFGVRAPEGERPGAAGTSITTFVVELVSYDRQTGVATVRTPDDEVVSVRVHSDLRRFASTRQPGDRILVAVEEAVAVNVVPAA